MTVYLLVHTDSDYYSGGSEVRGVYATRDAAEASIVSRTAAGSPSKSWMAHNESCCGVEEHAVLDAAVVDVREDDPPLVDTGDRLIPDAMVQTLVDEITRTNPFAKLSAR